MNGAQSSPASDRAQPQTRGQYAGLAIAILIFAIMGVCGVLATTLIPAVQALFAVSFTAAMTVQWLALVVSGLCSVPLALALLRIGPTRLIMIGLACLGAGCIGVWLSVAGATPSFLALVAALALAALGITALQVSANLLVVALGDSAQAAARLTLAQAFNSLGVFGGVWLGATTVLGAASGPATDAPTRYAHGIALAYGVCAAIVTLVLGLVVLMRRALGPAEPARALPAEQTGEGTGNLLRSRWALAGAGAIALYVGAEGAVGSMMTGFLHQQAIMALPLPVAGRYLATVYWGGALVGRFGGSWVLARQPAPRLLLIAALCAAAASLGAMTAPGPVAGGLALSIGLFNAIMFPVIFAITLERAGAAPAAVSGLLSTATAGGALISLAVGWIGDRAGLTPAFAVPMLAYLGVALFAGVALRSAPSGRQPQELRTTSSVGSRSDLI